MESNRLGQDAQTPCKHRAASDRRNIGIESDRAGRTRSRRRSIGSKWTSLGSASSNLSPSPMGQGSLVPPACLLR
eukprot:3413320-Pyramimonas_sp.AAC.1